MIWCLEGFVCTTVALKGKQSSWYDDVRTYQFSDYSRYAMTVFKEEDKRKYRDEHFETDLQNAYELGKRLVKKAEEQE